jgi:hypothetical protein
MNSFKPTRFILLFRKYLKENSKSQLLFFTAGFGFLFVMYGLTIVANFHNEFPSELQNVYYTVALFLGGTFYAGNFFNFLYNQAKSIQFILLPATAFEKLLVSFILTQVLYFTIFNISFLSIDHLLCRLYDSYVSIPADVPPHYRFAYKATNLNLSQPHIKELLVLYVICASITLLGSISFKKNAYPKTVLLIVIITAFLAYVNNTMLLSMIPEQIMPKGKFINESFRLGPKTQPTAIVKLTDAWRTTILVILPLFIYLCVWTTAYFKLKEKQL